MVDKIYIDKIANGYVVGTSWFLSSGDEKHSVYFKDMPQLVKHLDDCFVKPFKNIAKDLDADKSGNAAGND